LFKRDFVCEVAELVLGRDEVFRAVLQARLDAEKHPFALPNLGRRLYSAIGLKQ
jgi:hypothetical protein